jgi:hypothetical protein
MSKRLDTFVFSLLRHGAGIYKDDVSRLPQGDTLETSSLKLRDKSCAFCLIETTPKYFKCDCQNY